jgi:hypothetical protein
VTAVEGARSRRRWLPAIVVLSVPALAGAVLSYASLYEYARPTFGPVLAAGFPLLVDALVLGASLAYVTGAQVGRGRTGWRLIAHLGVAGTILLNALAAERLEDVALHVTAPIVWSLLVEMTAREVVGEYRATHERPADRIPLSLWLTAPVESARTFLLMRRLDERSAVRARVLVGAHAASREALVQTLPGWFARRARRVLRRQLRSGTLRPAVLMTAIGWGHGSRVVRVSPEDALRTALRASALDEGDAPRAVSSGPAPFLELPEPAAAPVVQADEVDEDADALDVELRDLAMAAAPSSVQSARGDDREPAARPEEVRELVRAGAVAAPVASSTSAVDRPAPVSVEFLAPAPAAPAVIDLRATDEADVASSTTPPATVSVARVPVREVREPAQETTGALALDVDLGPAGGESGEVDVTVLPKRQALRVAFAAVGELDAGKASSWLAERGVQVSRPEVYRVRTALAKAAEAAAEAAALEARRPALMSIAGGRSE